jgi:hypothetical protein
MTRKLQSEQEKTNHFKGLARDLKLRLGEHLKCMRLKKPGAISSKKKSGPTSDDMAELSRQVRN